MDDRALGSMLQNITSQIAVLKLTLEQVVIPTLETIERKLDKTIGKETKQALNDEAKIINIMEDKNGKKLH